MITQTFLGIFNWGPQSFLSEEDSFQHHFDTCQDAEISVRKETRQLVNQSIRKAVRSNISSIVCVLIQ